jgi:VanZ family protein
LPIGFFATGALCSGRRGTVAAGLSVAAAGFTLAVGIEFAQVFFPRRTVSLNDIAAETAGAAIGAALWAALGPGLAEWARAAARERERPTIALRLLQAYAALFFVSQLFPLDVTIDPGELAEKARAGRIVLVPFGHRYSSLALALWDLGTDMALWAPVGALAVLGWNRPGRRRGAVCAFAAGLALAALVEIAQVFIYSRFTDVTDVFAAAAGIAAGVALAVRRSGRAPIAAPARALRPAALAAAFGWAFALFFLFWFPFDVTRDPAHIEERLAMLRAPPFRFYYEGSEFRAFAIASAKLLLALPLGALLAIAVPACGRRARDRLALALVLGAVAALFFAIEIGKVFLREKVPDTTDVLLGTAGAAIGIAIARWLARPGSPERGSSCAPL